MCSLMLMMVEDGPGADGYDALSNSNSGGRVAGAGVCQSRLLLVCPLLKEMSRERECRAVPAT